MHVLVATAGALNPAPVVEFARHLIGGTGSVTVVTVVEVPHTFLEELETGDWHPLHEDAEPSTSRIAEQYLRERGNRLTDPIRNALETARIPCDVRVLEGEDAAARISLAAAELSADVVLLGATKQIFNRDAWESVSARVMLESGKPVLVLPEERRGIHDPAEVGDYQSLPEPAPESAATI